MTAPPFLRTQAHREKHLSTRSNWLRAAVLGANDGIVSTAGLVIGVAGAGATREDLVTAGIAGLAAGALSMAAGEYVSVSSQHDAEEADLRMEERELERNPEGELHELVRIYEQRGLSPELAEQVATALTENDALAAHSRDELGFDEDRRARPLQAAGASAAAFSVGALVPLLAIALAPASVRALAVAAVTVLALAVLGSVGARLGGAPALPAALRVVTWGAVAMAVTYAIGALVGAAT